MQIYLDYNATTPIDQEVANAMTPYLTRYFGNPSSMHQYGIETKKAIEKARQQVANLLNCQPSELIFTSGGTESNNYAIKGVAYAQRKKGNHIITSQIEHPAVIEVCKHLEKQGFDITYLPVDQYGLINIDELEQAIRPGTILISIMHANNEIGTLQPIQEIGKLAREKNILFHTDAAQSTGKIPIDVKQLQVDLLSVAGHKLYAPKGIGALFIRDGVTLEKLMHGADHERNLRAGTENVLEIVGLGKACEIATRDMLKNKDVMMKARDLLHNQLKDHLPDTQMNGHPENRLPNTLSLSFPGTEANLIVNELADKGIAVSAGAACHTESIDISAVLRATGVEEYVAMGTIRFSTGKHTTEKEINQAATLVIDVVNKLKPSTGKPHIKPTQQTYRLTQYTQGMGCACKLRPQELEKILTKLPLPDDPAILIDTKHSDDAAVYEISDDIAIVQTVDFFTPVVDDPYTFGKIAAANALSDIYAMGADPLFALNIVGFPSSRLPAEILEQILQGANHIAKEAGISIIGGHTIDDPEPKYGMAVTGKIHPGKILSNSKAEEGDAIILTKPIGTGILSTAVKRGLAEPETVQDLHKIMASLNKIAAEIMKDFPVHACTDVTGFGLTGHLFEVSKASQIPAELFLKEVPLINKTKEFAAANLIPGGTYNNLDFFSHHIIWDEGISELEKLILCDAQTSGGLLIILPEDQKNNLVKKLENKNIQAKFIGRFKEKGIPKIFVKNQ